MTTELMSKMKRVLFVCVENAGRSQMAEAYANHYGKGKLVASSAGVMLADKVNPVVIEAMKEKRNRHINEQTQTPHNKNGRRS